ncbi:MAG TPA: BTAD domain-containing putative transcriptional regulator, partial [Pseudonocardiaceae bacterium]
MLFRVLGPLDVGRPVESDQQRLLLALLLSRANDWVPAADIDAVLPGVAVRPLVHRLRQALPRTAEGSPRLNSRAGSVRLNVADDEWDVPAFTGLLARGRVTNHVDLLGEALTLWRGRPFDPLDEEAANPRAAELLALRWEARDALADALLATGRTPEAVAHLEELADEDPSREATWHRLVTALDRAERPDDAVVAYERARDALAEHGREPGEELAAAYRRVTGDDTTQRVAPALVRAADRA